MSKVEKTKLTKSQVKKAIEKSSCSYTQLSGILHVSRNTLRRFMKKFPELQELFDKQLEFMIEESEDVIYEKIINDRDPRWASWFLKVKGNWGYRDMWDKDYIVERSGDLGVHIIIKDAPQNTEED